MKRGLSSLVVLVALSGCATAAFRTPAYEYRATTTATPVAMDTANIAHVQYYLRGITDTFDKMIGQSEWLKHTTELPIIGAGVFAPTWLALGKNNDGAIYAAGVGAAGGAFSSYFGVRGRETAVAQARAAITCVNKEYIFQMTTGRTLASLLDKSKAANLAATTDARTISVSLASSPGSTGDVAAAGEIAIAAADEIISKLKVKLAGMGSIPDYNGIIKDLQAKQKLSEARGATIEASGIDDEHKVLAKAIAEYPGKVATCVAGFQ